MTCVTPALCRGPPHHELRIYRVAQRRKKKKHHPGIVDQRSGTRTGNADAAQAKGAQHLPPAPPSRYPAPTMAKMLNYFMIAINIALVSYLLVKSLVSPPTCTVTLNGCIPILKS